MQTEVDILSNDDSGTNRFFGKFRGTVTNNQDPNNLGRIKANVKDVLRDVESGWALPALPYSGDGVGVYTVPAVGAGVWIEFEAGDVSNPIWTGCFWGADQLPKDETGSDTTPDKKIIRTEQGLLLAFDDGGKTIALSDSNGNNLLKFTIDQGHIKMQAGTKVVIEAPQIELVENATHPLVFGDNLLTYLNQLVMIFNTHIHPGELALGVFPITPAPPVGPFPSATPSLLSTKVKCG
ncbi:MAG TPA: phage baseplate assembly protein V [Pyrinomonadaceae bacterium]|nr:phage baseplate assembly protein V [Pyrinomonadaceae bacterium]